MKSKNVPVAAAATEVATATDAAEASLRQSIFAIGQQVGAIQMARVQSSFLRAAEIRLFAQLRESKEFKHLPLLQPDGSLRAAETIAEFSSVVFGASYSRLAEDQQNLEALGDEAYDAANRLGLNRNALRAVRALPPAQVEQVQKAIAGGCAKAEVLSVIEDLAERASKAEEALADMQADREAADHVSAEKTKRIDQLKSEVRRFNKLPQDKQLKALQEKAVSFMRGLSADIRGGLRQAVIEINSHGDVRGQHEAFVGGLVAELADALEELRQEFRLPHVAAAQRPWLAGTADLPRRPDEAQPD